MGKRRGRGEGTITQRANGLWEVRVDLGRGEDGRRRRKTAYAATQAAAVDKLATLRGREVEGVLLTTSTPSVRAFLEEWFGANQDTWRPSTRGSYRATIDHFLVPAFGTLRLEQLSPVLVQRWLRLHKAKHGARRRISLAHAVLRSALTEAVKLGVLTHNAASNVKVPQPIARAITCLEVDQARIFLGVAERHRLAALFMVALACGLRLGEATGLCWDHVDLATGEIRIRQQLQPVGRQLVLQPLKTERSRRDLVVPDVCLTLLRAHRTRQLEERLKAGASWVDTGLVFTTYTRVAGYKSGAGLHPRNVLRTLHTILTAAGLPRMRFHDLRHSAASLLIAEGVEIVAISQLLGHAEIRTTSDLYGHLHKQTAARAAQRMDGVLRPSSVASQKPGGVS